MPTTIGCVCHLSYDAPDMSHRRWSQPNSLPDARKFSSTQTSQIPNFEVVGLLLIDRPSRYTDVHLRKKRRGGGGEGTFVPLGW